MIAAVICILLALSVIAGICTGNLSAVSNAAISQGYEAVKLVLSLVGGIALWNGLMKIAVDAGLTRKISRLFLPILKLIFRGIEKNKAACDAICMNITANMLGLGNAATPLGLLAMKELAKDAHGPVATNNMALFVVVNTASVQLIPTTVALLRYGAGSAAPMEILPCVWITSVVALTGGVLIAKLLSGIYRLAPSTNGIKEVRRWGRSPTT